MERLPIVTLAEVKDFLDIRDNITKLDTRLTGLIDVATKQIEKVTGRHYTRQTFTEYFASRDNSKVDYNLNSPPGYSSIGETGLIRQWTPTKLYLKGYSLDRDAPIRVWYDPYDFAYGDDREITLNQGFRVDLDEDVILIDMPTIYRVDAIKVEYTAGYAAGGTPPTLSEAADSVLKMAALVQTQYLNVKLRNDNIGMGTERTVSAKDKVISTDFLSTQNLTPEAASMLSDHKRVIVGKL